MSMTGYYPHAAQDFHIAGNVVLREIGRIITNLSLNIVDHRAMDIQCTYLNIKTFHNYTKLMCRITLELSHNCMHETIIYVVNQNTYKQKRYDISYNLYLFVSKF